VPGIYGAELRAVETSYLSFTVASHCDVLAAILRGTTTADFVSVFRLLYSTVMGTYFRLSSDPLKTAN
jgi:hypothetical protein